MKKIIKKLSDNKRLLIVVMSMAINVVSIIDLCTLWYSYNYGAMFYLMMIPTYIIITYLSLYCFGIILDILYYRKKIRFSYFAILQLYMWFLCRLYLLT